MIKAMYKSELAEAAGVSIKTLSQYINRNLGSPAKSCVDKWLV